MMDDYEYKRWEARKEPLESDEWKRSPSKKKRQNLKKFCRGIEGRAHSVILKKSSWANGRECGTGEQWWQRTCYHYRVCENCGKRLSYSSERYCAEYNENLAARRKVEEEARMIAFRAKYHIKEQA